ncbi:hypothetical protein API480_15 [Paenibacillus phage vB_PlaP_API480]|nr:hypothetical protein API480_15 [Paenibacillus phage vB_PlaP_API480]
MAVVPDLNIPNIDLGRIPSIPSIPGVTSSIGIPVGSLDPNAIADRNAQARQAAMDQIQQAAREAYDYGQSKLSSNYFANLYRNGSDPYANIAQRQLEMAQMRAVSDLAQERMIADREAERMRQREGLERNADLARINQENNYMFGDAAIRKGKFDSETEGRRFSHQITNADIANQAQMWSYGANRQKERDSVADSHFEQELALKREQFEIQKKQWENYKKKQKRYFNNYRKYGNGYRNYTKPKKISKIDRVADMKDLRTRTLTPNASGPIDPNKVTQKNKDDVMAKRIGYRPILPGFNPPQLQTQPKPPSFLDMLNNMYYRK